MSATKTNGLKCLGTIAEAKNNGLLEGACLVVSSETVKHILEGLGAARLLSKNEVHGLFTVGENKIVYGFFGTIPYENKSLYLIEG